MDIIALNVIELSDAVSGSDKKVQEVVNLPHCRILRVSLKNNDVLTKHRSAEPISVLCLDGGGYFKIGREGERVERLKSGTLVTLSEGIDHEVVADPDVVLLVTKFKQY